MASVNRGRYAVERGDGWRRYLRRALDEHEMIGEVCVAGESGALVKDARGEYFLARQGRRKVPLLAFKVEAALHGAAA